MSCNHQDRATLEKMHTHQREVPAGYKPFSVDWYYCPSCKLPIGVAFVIPHPKAKRLGDLTLAEYGAYRKGLLKPLPDTVQEAALMTERVTP